MNFCISELLRVSKSILPSQVLCFVHNSNENKLEDIFICVESRKKLEINKSKHSRENLVPVPVASPLREGR